MPVVGPGLHATCPAAAAAVVRQVPESVEAAASRVARAGRAPAPATAGAAAAAGSGSSTGSSTSRLQPGASPADDAYDTPWTDLAR
jgi:hypothetical protein